MARQKRHSGRRHRKKNKIRNANQVTDSPKPLDYFPLFPRLPVEIRAMIWNLAISCHIRPKLHYYSLSNEDHPGYRESFLPLLLHAYMHRHGLEKKPPRRIDEKPPPLKDRLLRTQRHQFAWTEANRFQYYWNAGLRTAFWESRSVLMKHYTKIRRDLAEKEQSSTEKGASAKPSATKTRKQKPLSERQIVKKRNEIAAKRVTVTIKEGRYTIFIDFSPRDIICFRFPPEHLAACAFLEWDRLLTRVPFFQLPYASDLNLAFEFQDGWEKGLGNTVESVCDHLSEPSVRGLVMRLHWSWAIGKIPRWTRIYLINPRKDLPIRYKLGLGARFRYRRDSVYGEKFQYKRGADYCFFDGKNKFVDSCSWDGYRENPPYVWRNIPICKFIWRVAKFCRSQGRTDIFSNLPKNGHDFCLRVLRQLPNSNDIQ